MEICKTPSVGPGRTGTARPVFPLRCEEMAGLSRKLSQNADFRLSCFITSCLELSVAWRVCYKMAENPR